MSKNKGKGGTSHGGKSKDMRGRSPIGSSVVNPFARDPVKPAAPSSGVPTVSKARETTSSKLDPRPFQWDRRSEAEAPYNFVPLAERVIFAEEPGHISQDRPFADGLSGTVRFSIEVETDLCVGGEREKASDRSAGTVEFLTTPDGEVSIGGSSLRGMIRNVLEIATFAKFRMITPDRRFAMRELSGPNKTLYVGRFSDQSKKAFRNGRQSTCYRPKSLAGWMSFDADRKRWKIQPAEFARIEQRDLMATDTEYATFRVGRDNQSRTESASATEKYLYWTTTLGRSTRGTATVSPPGDRWHERKDKPGEYFATWERLATNFTPDDGSGAVRPGMTAGELVFTGQVSAKHKEFFFFNPGTTFRDVPEDVMERFMEVQGEKITRAIGDGKSQETHWQYLRKLLEQKGKPIPVFFLLDAAGKEIENIGLSMMFPLPYDFSIGDLANRQKDREKPAPDWPEAIFGTIGDGAADADRPEHERGLKGRVSFSLARVVGGRNVTTQRSRVGILGEPKPSFYPAYIDQEGGAGASYMRTSAGVAAKLRGWKRYPVRDLPAQTAAMEKNLETKHRLQTALKAVPPGTRFEAKLRFHNLRPFELGAVLWAMTFGDTDGTTPYRHALGTGKPWGLGRVRLAVETEGWSEAVRPNAPGAQVPSLADLVSGFEAAMDRSTRSIGLKPWRQSPQIEALLAMADPANAPDGRNAAVGHLQTMPLKLFAEAKKQGASLGRYKGRSSS